MVRGVPVIPRGANRNHANLANWWGRKGPTGIVFIEALMGAMFHNLAPTKATTQEFFLTLDDESLVHLKKFLCGIVWRPNSVVRRRRLSPSDRTLHA